MQRRERTLVFPDGSPCLAGHFPGNPVVPAVAILAELIIWTESELERSVIGVASARFRRPLLPGVRWNVSLEDRGTGDVTVTGRDGEGVAMTARLTLENK